MLEVLPALVEIFRAPPASAWLPVKVLPVTLSVAVVLLALMAPPSEPELLLEKVELVTVSGPRSSIAPPLVVAVLPEKVLLLMVAVTLLFRYIPPAAVKPVVGSEEHTSE